MLKGELVTLRPIRLNDWEKTIQWRNDMRNKTSNLSHPFPITEEQEQLWYKNKVESYDNSFIPFIIVENVSGESVGFMNLISIDWINRHCFVGGTVGAKVNQGKGYGKEAVALLVKYAFSNLNLNKVYAHVLETHPAMKSWVDLGAKIEGALKEHAYIKGKYENVCVLAWYPNFELK